MSADYHQWNQDAYGNWNCPSCKTIAACCDADDRERAKTETVDTKVRRRVGTTDQWARVDAAERVGGGRPEARRAAAANEAARLFGTDPSWYGF